MSKKIKQAPFHESIIVAINGAGSKEELSAYANLIVATKVPAGHKEIMDSLRQKAKELNGGNIAGLKKAICLLKVAAREKEESGKKAPEMFFPPYLNQGSKGPAVALLQCLLLNRGNNPSMVVDGIYGEETAKGVKQLQAEIDVEQDGHFGPATRKALVADGGLDINAIPASAFLGKTEAVGP